MMTIEQILIREFHLKFPHAKSISATVDAGDEVMTVTVDGVEWVMELARGGDELVFTGGGDEIAFPFPDDWPS
jgi:hypothetical protein